MNNQELPPESLPSDLPSIMSETPSLSTAELNARIRLLQDDNKLSSSDSVAPKHMVEEAKSPEKEESHDENSQPCKKVLTKQIEQILVQAQTRIITGQQKETKKRGPSVRKVARLTLQQKEALEDLYQMKR